MVLAFSIFSGEASTGLTSIVDFVVVVLGLVAVLVSVVSEVAAEELAGASAGTFKLTEGAKTSFVNAWGAGGITPNLAFELELLGSFLPVAEATSAVEVSRGLEAVIGVIADIIII
jgi:hypothetical protein